MKTVSSSLLFLLLLASLAVGQSGAEFDQTAIEARVREMKVQDIAWRKIAWKTCLIDALQTSKEQRKPIIAWVFIDRPIDDERC